MTRAELTMINLICYAVAFHASAGYIYSTLTR